MRAILLTAPSGADTMTFAEVPEPAPGEVNCWSASPTPAATSPTR